MSTTCSMYHFIIVVILCAAISVSCSFSLPPKERSNETDRTALLALRDAFVSGGRTPPANSALSLWNSSFDFCQWKGVTCGDRHKRVTVIHLSGEMLDGVVSPSIGNLTFLRVLTLANNSLHGEIPKEIGQLWSIERLHLEGNYFQGNIPMELSNCSYLQWLFLDNNNLTGQIPSQFVSLSKLILFDVSQNSLAGEMPDFFNNFSSLNTLDLSENHFHGEIRDSLRGLSNLKSLSLNSNSLGGIIPYSIGKLTKLSELYLNGNKLHGGIPSSIGNLTHLNTLVLSRNSLNGNIPTTLGNCKGINVIDISRNHLSGKLSGGVFTLFQYLRYIDISFNSFHGKLSDDVFTLFENLIYFDISYNSFHGMFSPLIYESLGFLSTLNASYNNFSGEIPSQLAYAALENLNLAGNSFEGCIPLSLGSLGTLKYLDLSNNKLSGPIPKEFARTAGLQNLNLSFNHLEGQVPNFKNASVVVTVGNKELCGGNLELQLPPCTQYHWKQAKTSLKKLLISITLSVLTSFLIFVLLIIFVRKQRKYDKADEDGSLTEGYPRVTYAKLLRATEGFKESNLIGTGYYGDVYKGIIFDDDEMGPVAVKVLNLSKLGATKSFIGECKVLSRIRHRNLLRLITSCSGLDHKGNDFKALVYDFMSNGSLDNWLHLKDPPRGSRSGLTFAKRLEIAIDVGCALEYLHNDCETPIVHCDLKPSNILLDHDMVAHVGDFGLAKLLLGATENFNNGGESMSSICFKGTIGYVAPEYGMGALASPRGDTYSYGILLLELITGRRPTNDMFNDEMNIQSFCKRALPDRVEEVVDRSLVNELHKVIIGQMNPEQIKLQFQSFLISFVEIGVSCSAESSRGRMDIKSVIWCLKDLKEKYDKVVQNLKPSITASRVREFRG